MKAMTPAMLLKALTMFRGFTQTAAEFLRDKERLRHLLAVAVSIAQGRGGKLLNDLQLLVRLLKASGAFWPRPQELLQGGVASGNGSSTATSINSGR